MLFLIPWVLGLREWKIPLMGFLKYSEHIRLLHLWVLFNFRRRTNWILIRQRNIKFARVSFIQVPKIFYCPLIILQILFINFLDFQWIGFFIFVFFLLKAKPEFSYFYFFGTLSPSLSISNVTCFFKLIVIVLINKLMISLRVPVVTLFNCLLDFFLKLFIILNPKIWPKSLEWS